MYLLKFHYDFYYNTCLKLYVRFLPSRKQLKKTIMLNYYLQQLNLFVLYLI